MRFNFSIVAECYADTLFGKVISGVAPMHASGSEVQKPFIERPTSKLLAIIDRDKRIHHYFTSFQLILDLGTFQLLKHRSNEHYAIVAIPAMEKAIFAIIEVHHVNVKAKGLPTEKNALMRIFKSPGNHQPQLANLLNELVQKDSGLQKLREFVNEHFPTL